tara:strand:+ start:362 stop:1291 length:930 start_codon:yes stop_codon:yes gene_type:complete
MRNRIAQKLVEFAQKDEKLILLAGDIGFRIFDEFIDKFPERFINCGIAEQNMISVSAGLASEGMKPVVYTIIPFLIMRAFEQIRVDIGINNQPVILIGVGGGLAYDKLGSTHHAYEDIALMRCIPNMNIFSPFSPSNAGDCFTKAWEKLIGNNSSPSYIRLCKGGEPNIPMAKEIRPNIFSTRNLNSSKCIVSTGAIASIIDTYINRKKVSKLIDHIIISEISIETILELNKILIESSIKKVLIIEEHFESGGLFEFIAGIFVKTKSKIELENLCLDKKYIFEIFDREILLENNGINFTFLDKWIKENE